MPVSSSPMGGDMMDISPVPHKGSFINMDATSPSPEEEDNDDDMMMESPIASRQQASCGDRNMQEYVDWNRTK